MKILISPSRTLASAFLAASVLSVGCDYSGVFPVTPAPEPSPTPHHGWNVLYNEDFENLSPIAFPGWAVDTSHDRDDAFSDDGSFFQNQGVTPPLAFRASVPFGKDSWLTAESYTRTQSKEFNGFFDVVADPGNAQNHVLKIRSSTHTDATIVRPSFSLPTRYRVCLRVGYANFGNGISDPANLNGYLGGERSEPWYNDDATKENGFYWLTIVDREPRPHNNVWAHHHRKVVIDSDNNKDAWTSIWTGSEWINSGEHPVMMFGLDKNGLDNDRIGKPFLSYSAGSLQPSGDIKAVDAYLDNTWYTACIERNPTSYTLSTAGVFKYGGFQIYSAEIPIEQIYNALETPDWFMFGDPHENYYRGEVYYDDIELGFWQD